MFWEVDSGLGDNGPWHGTTADQHSVADAVKANLSRNATTDMAGTVFGLLPIVALVIVAAIILGVILGFGAAPGKKGGI